MAQAAAGQTQQAQGIEYAIYTFEKAPSGGGKSGNAWERHDVSGDMQVALAQADTLFGSGRYRKIEIRQKYFDKKKNRNIDMVLKTLELQKKREINLLMVFAFALLCGAAAFGATYLLANG